MKDEFGVVVDTLWLEHNLPTRTNKDEYTTGFSDIQPVIMCEGQVIYVVQ